MSKKKKHGHSVAPVHNKVDKKMPNYWPILAGFTSAPRNAGTGTGSATDDHDSVPDADDAPRTGDETTV